MSNKKDSGKWGRYIGYGVGAVAVNLLRFVCSFLSGVLLWGSYAQKKASFVDRTRNLVLSCAHPSPLSAYRGFFGCGHFKAANEYLVAHGQEGISW